MRDIDLELLKKCANNLMFEMKEEEYQTLLSEFDVLTQQMSLIGKLEGIDDTTPMTFPFPCAVTWIREDVEGEMISKKEALSNVKDVFGGQVKLPKVVN